MKSKMAKKNNFVKRNIMQDVENLTVERPNIHPLSMDEVVLFLEKVNPHYRNFVEIDSNLLILLVIIGGGGGS